MTTRPKDGLRRDQLAATRRRIAEATVEVITRDGAAALSFPAVAEEAGVSLRTVYRHYPNKDELVLAAVRAGSEAAREVYPQGLGAESVREYLPKLWATVYRQRDLVAVQHATPRGVEARRERLRERRDGVRRTLRHELPDVPAPDRRRLADLLTVLLGSSLLFDLVDHLEVDLDDAAGLAAYAIESVIDRARAEGGIR